MSDATSDYGALLERIRAKGRIQIVGATEEERRVIRAALSLYESRNLEKHVERPHMGWGEQARIAGELTIRME